MPELRWNRELKGWERIVKDRVKDSVAIERNREREDTHLARSLEHHRNILDNMASGIIAVDLDGQVTVFNHTAEKILGFKADKVLGKDIRMIQGNLAGLIMDTLNNGTSYKREEVYILPENILVGVSSSQFHDAGGELVGAAMVFADLSKVKQDERRQRRIERENFWERLATALAHEIKNSIVAARTLTQLLPEQYNDEEFRKTLCEAVGRDTRKLNEFTERIISYAQPIELNLKSLHVHEVIDNALSMAADDLQSRGVDFVKQYDGAIPETLLDPDQLREVFTNIILNGIEAMGGIGKMNITTERGYRPEISAISNKRFSRRPLWMASDTELMSIQFTDTGPGISQDNLDRLFDPFFTVKKGHASLGLAIAQKIIENHNGFIEVESRVGKGTTFKVCLPVTRGER